MVELALIVAGVCNPETFDSLPNVEFAVVGEGRQYPAEDEGLSETDDEGKKPVLGGHCVSMGCGKPYPGCCTGTVPVSDYIIKDMEHSLLTSACWRDMVWLTVGFTVDVISGQRIRRQCAWKRRAKLIHFASQRGDWMPG